MTKYDLLVRVLDQLCHEAPTQYAKYHPPIDKPELLNAARCRAYIHLLLKSYFGLLAFDEREPLLTEGSNDGGVDAYYIDEDAKTIYFVQSKFRTTEVNFLEKGIDPEELLRMDLDRMLAGETQASSGVPYSGKIQGMIRRIAEIQDIGRYHYRVILLANIKGITREKSAQLTGGFPCEVVDYNAAYNKLLFPLLTGTYFTPDSLHISLSLGNKNSGPKISYTVDTAFTACTITVVFVPAVEIAKAMHKFRNAILKFNPRSYLEHEGQTVNAAIRSSIENRSTNEFALFNNGITILSDESYLNERIGQKDKARLTMVNPQIINGGQTAYTLSVIYREGLLSGDDAVFGTKEVLVKIITFEKSAEFTDERRNQLIEDISRATNQQTVVTNADRRSNEAAFQELQTRLFEKCGILLERKRGEFSDGIREGYLDRSEIIERNSFVRVASAVLGDFRGALDKKLVQKCDFSRFLLVDDQTFEKYSIAVSIFKQLVTPKGKQKQAVKAKLLTKVLMGVCHFFRPGNVVSKLEMRSEKTESRLDAEWSSFLEWAKQSAGGSKFVRFNARGDRIFNVGEYLRKGNVASHLAAYFNAQTTTPSGAAEGANPPADVTQ